MTAIGKRGLLIAAPASGSGKTLVTLALLRALKNAGHRISGAKAGPDYIDPGFHEIACGIPSVNLDPWAMGDVRLVGLAQAQPGSDLLVEGMMGLFDGAVDGTGSPASLAKTLDIPVLLVVDTAKQSHSVAALVRGFRDHDSDLKFAGAILNRVGSVRHEAMLRDALDTIGVAVLGAIPRFDRLTMPQRHLGLVQASARPDMEALVAEAAEVASTCCDLDTILAAAGTIRTISDGVELLLPLGQRIAVARDAAFSFIYPHLIQGWRRQGAEINFFSPLADEAPNADADAVFLPGGYPELHAAKLSSAQRFISGMKQAAGSGTCIYGECGGYMALGEGLVDADGTRHLMLGLLGLETSFEQPKLHLGYRKLVAEGFALGDRLNGHEFHYTSALRERGEPLFEAKDVLGENLGKAGLRAGNVAGSYMHVIDRVLP